MLYIASFSFERVKEGVEEEGTFQVLLPARDVDAAVAAAKSYLVALHDARGSELFDGHVTLLLDSLIELNRSPERPALINYVSRQAIRSAGASLHCDIFDGEDQVQSYGWGPDGHDPATDDAHTVEPFLELGASSAPTRFASDSEQPAGELPEKDPELDDDFDDLDDAMYDEALFAVRWPNGSASVVQACSLKEVAMYVDEIDDPGRCEVARFQGSLSLTFEPTRQLEDNWLEFSASQFESSRDCQRELIRAAYPVLNEALDAWEARRSDEEIEQIDSAAWSAAIEKEMARELAPSEEWTAAISAWWRDMSGGSPDRTAALRQMMDVTIPGEPQPETPEQRAWFAAEQRRMMERVADALHGEMAVRAAPSPPKSSKPKPSPKKKAKTQKARPASKKHTGARSSPKRPATGSKPRKPPRR